MFKPKPNPKITEPTEKEKPLADNEGHKSSGYQDAFVTQLFGARSEKQKDLNYTPLDKPQKNLTEAEQMDQLRAQIKQEQEKEQQNKTAAQKRFEAVVTESKQAIEQRKKIEMERKQKAVREEQDKLEEEKQKNSNRPLEEPSVKIHRSIFSIGKKKKTVETKVGFGKQ